MKQKSILAFAFATAIFFSCSSIKKSSTTPTWLITEDVQKDETYQKIIKNDARLYAMISGVFLQYVTWSGDSTYSIWKLNEGKDSMILSAIPVGTPSKDGYWLYHYQYMTDLPDKPLMTAFSRLENIDRDTILQIFYEVPKGFNPPMNKILKDVKQTFSEIEFDSLKLSPIDEQVLYWRISPLYFEGVSSFVTSRQNEPHTMFTKDFFKISPQRIKQQRRHYNKEKNKYINAGPEKFEKLANVRGFDNVK